MLVALLSDVHGNVDALEAVRNDIKEAVPKAYEGREVELVWFLGDLIGRGPKPLESIDLFQDWEREVNIRYLAGNHEALYLGTEPAELANPVANGAIEVHRRLLKGTVQGQWLLDRFTDRKPRSESHDPENTHRLYVDADRTYEHLLRLRDSFANEYVDLLVCHGTWFYEMAFGYLYPDNWKPDHAHLNRERIRRHMALLADSRHLSPEVPSVLVAGHTHLPMAFHMTDPTRGDPEKWDLPANQVRPLGSDFYVFNAGSVGHTRIGNAQTTRYLLIDMTQRTIELRQMPYTGNLQRSLVETYGLTDLFRELQRYFLYPPRNSDFEENHL